jgi:hypothetical protein
MEHPEAPCEIGGALLDQFARYHLGTSAYIGFPFLLEAKV